MASLKVKIDVTKLDKSAFFKGTKGTYCDLILWENDQPDEYGNTHSVKQDMGKDRKGEKTPYVGNAKPIGGGSNRPTSQGGAQPPRQSTPGQASGGDTSEWDSVPFAPHPSFYF